MKKDKISKIVIEVVSDQLGVEPVLVTPEAKIVDTLGADSLDVIELIMYTEEKFDIEISDEEVEATRTVQDVVDLVYRIKNNV